MSIEFWNHNLALTFEFMISSTIVLKKIGTIKINFKYVWNWEGQYFVQNYLYNKSLIYYDYNMHNWQYKNIFKITITLKVKKNSNISSICNTFCKIENLMQTNAF